MTEAVSAAPAPAMPPYIGPSLQNPAVAYCCEVWESTLRRSLKEGKNLVFARVAAHKAYQRSLPPLTGDENIRNFIACVAQGILLGAILSRDGARLARCRSGRKSRSPQPGEATQDQRGILRFYRSRGNKNLTLCR
jgi:hypothetical protein